MVQSHFTNFQNEKTSDLNFRRKVIFNFVFRQSLDMFFLKKNVILKTKKWFIQLRFQF